MSYVRLASRGFPWRWQFATLLWRFALILLGLPWWFIALLVLVVWDPIYIFWNLGRATLVSKNGTVKLYARTFRQCALPGESVRDREGREIALGDRVLEIHIVNHRIAWQRLLRKHNDWHKVLRKEFESLIPALNGGFEKAVVGATILPRCFYYPGMQIFQIPPSFDRLLVGLYMRWFIFYVFRGLRLTLKTREPVTRIALFLEDLPRASEPLR